MRQNDYSLIHLGSRLQESDLGLSGSILDGRNRNQDHPGFLIIWLEHLASKSKISCRVQPHRKQLSYCGIALPSAGAALPPAGATLPPAGAALPPVGAAVPSVEDYPPSFRGYSPSCRGCCTSCRGLSSLLKGLPAFLQGATVPPLGAVLPPAGVALPPAGDYPRSYGGCPLTVNLTRLL